VTVYDTLSTPLGTLFLLMKGKSLAGISFTKPRMKTGRAPEAVKRELTDYFAGRLREFTLGILLTGGTEFEKEVWRALRDVPYGETRSYKWLAERVGRPGGSRAVGQALAKNPIPIVLPCHRIIESKGKLGGYTPGVDVKRRLLFLEHYHSEGERKR
jgi:methylated-DNA-[protein]-cysteine S-methyltransferase